MDLVIITGMSGAGKSSTLNIFEDMGYYSMDNLPPQLIPDFVQLAMSSNQEINKVAIGVDVRSRSFFEHFKTSLDSLSDLGVSVSILFLEASDEVLINRYKELRRPHPMDKAGNIYDGIQRERAYLEEVRLMADEVIDSSQYILGQLKAVVEEIYSGDKKERGLIITINSFSYKRGIALDADLVFDARFLPNPHYIPDLRDKNGLNQEIHDYVFSYDQSHEFVDRLMDLLSFLLPLFKEEGKRTLSIAIGCTGGKHRSVAVAEELGKRLKEAGEVVTIHHRDSHAW